MKGRIYLLFILYFLAFTSFAYAENDIKKFFGVWHIASIADYAKITSIDDKQANIPIGHYFTISRESTKFNDHLCKARYTFLKVNPAENLQEGYRISNNRLKLPNPVLLLDTGCEFVYLVKDKQIIIEKWGIFYRAMKK